MEKPSASAIVDKMYENDLFSKWLGIDILEKGIGKSKLAMTIRQEMLNGFGVAHGGITYSLADSALAFAAIRKEGNLCRLRLPYRTQNHVMLEMC